MGNQRVKNKEMTKLMSIFYGKSETSEEHCKFDPDIFCASMASLTLKCLIKLQDVQLVIEKERFRN